MGWRDRVKKSFAYSADIAEGTQNLKNPEKKEKEGLKTTFRHITQNTQYPQNPKNGPDEGGKSKDPKPDQGNTYSTVKIGKSENNRTPAQNIPAPSPPGMGPEYKRIWNQAWTLAEWIDNPAAAPIEVRRARLPELDDLRERMAAICASRTNKPVPPAGPEPEPSPPGTWHTWESTDTTTAMAPTPKNCPAKCKRSGKCYAGAYFKGKTGRVKDCEPETCIHISNERGSHDS